MLDYAGWRVGERSLKVYDGVYRGVFTLRAIGSLSMHVGIGWML